MERLPDNGNNDIIDCVWIVNMQEDHSGSKRVRVQAMSEMGALLAAEERFGGVAISAFAVRPLGRLVE